MFPEVLSALARCGAREDQAVVISLHVGWEGLRGLMPEAALPPACPFKRPYLCLEDRGIGSALGNWGPAGFLERPWAATQSLIETLASSPCRSANRVTCTHLPPFTHPKENNVTFEESKGSPHQQEWVCQKVSLLAARPSIPLSTLKDSAFFS